jgi:hypothetical protein
MFSKKKLIPSGLIGENKEEMAVEIALESQGVCFHSILNQAYSLPTATDELHKNGGPFPWPCVPSNNNSYSHEHAKYFSGLELRACYFTLLMIKWTQNRRNLRCRSTVKLKNLIYLTPLFPRRVLHHTILLTYYHE